MKYYNNTKELIYDFVNNNILVIGDMMLDEYIFVEDTCFKENYVKTSTKTNEIKYCLGGAGNVLSNLFNLNSNSYICTVQGKFDNYKFYKLVTDLFIKLSNKEKHKKVSQNWELTPEQRIKYNNLRISVYNNILVNDYNDFNAIIKTRYINNYTKEIEYRIDTENTKDFKFGKDYLDSIANTDLTYFFNKYDKNKAILFSDYNKGFIKEELLNPIKNRLDECFIVVDPHPGNDFNLISYLNKIDLLKLNISEFHKFLQIKDKDLAFKVKLYELQFRDSERHEFMNIKELIQNFIELYNKNIKYFVLTLDKFGIIYYNNETKEIKHSESFFKEKVINTNGAGDSVISFLTNVGMLTEITKEHIDISNLCASTIINKDVTVPIDLEYVLSIV